MVNGIIEIVKLVITISGLLLAKNMQPVAG